MAVVCAGKHTSGIASSFPLTRTRTKHTLPDVPPTRRLHYSSTLMSTEAEGRQTAVRVCPRRRDAQRCPRGRDAAGHVSVGPPLAFLPSACTAALPCGLEPPRRAGSGLLRARLPLRADLQAMGGSGESPSPPRSGRWNPRALCLQQVRLCPWGSVRVLCQESQR